MNETITTPVATTAVETPKVNKSQLVNEAFKAKGLDTPSRDIIESIKTAHGVDVTVNLVNVRRLSLRREKEERKAKRQASTAPKVEAPATVAVQENAVTRLLQVKEFAGKVGGVSALKDLLTQLEQLTA